MLPAFQTGSLKKITVTVDGTWQTAVLRRDWNGKAQAAEPIVAIVLNGLGEWAKSDRPLLDGSLSVRLLIAPYDNE